MLTAGSLLQTRPCLILTRASLGGDLKLKTGQWVSQVMLEVLESLEFVPSTDWLKSPLFPTLPLPSGLPASMEYGKYKAQVDICKQLSFLMWGARNPHLCSGTSLASRLPSMLTT